MTGLIRLVVGGLRTVCDMRRCIYLISEFVSFGDIASGVASSTLERMRVRIRYVPII